MIQSFLAALRLVSKPIFSVQNNNVGTDLGLHGENLLFRANSILYACL